MTTPASCPTPTKHRFATPQAAAKYALARELGVGTLLTPYACPCEWVHLTSQPQIPARAVADPATVTAYHYATHDVFVRAVEADASGRLDLDGRVALRHPRISGRWTTALRAVLTRIDRELSAEDADPDWARRAAVFRWNVAARLVEAESLRDTWGGVA